MIMSPAKMAELIEMSFGMLSGVGPRKYCKIVPLKLKELF